MNREYYYFATHTINESIYKRLEAGVEYKNLTQKEQDLLDLLIEGYPYRDKEAPILSYCSDFIKNRTQEFHNLIQKKGYSLRYFLRDYLGFHFKWGASTKSFGEENKKAFKKDKSKALKISETELIDEMINPKGSIKKLLDTANGDRKMVKSFLPYVMLSLDTDTRDKQKMKFKHTGMFVFDFDKVGDEKTTVQWMNKVWKGTENIKAYMAFVSPSGNGFKIFCQVDTSTDNFKDDFSVEVEEEVIAKHKIWYDGALKELKATFPTIADEIDEKINDPTRLTFLPFIANKREHFKYDPKAISEYSTLVEQEKEVRRIDKEKKMKKHEAEVKALMQKEGIKSKDDAYNLLLKNRSKDFDLEFELDKFKKVVAYIVDLSVKDGRVKKWLEEKFSSYGVLNKQAWVLYGVFGSIAIDELKKLIPLGSNKSDESHGDYRWANKSDDTYDEETRLTITPAPFYKLVFEIGSVKDYCLDHFSVTSSCVSDFKLINTHYKNYKYNLDLLEENKDQGDKEAFLQQIRHHLKSKENRLPLLKDLEETKADIKLGKSEYLDKKKMEDIFQNKYGDKKIFMLRSQCGKQPVPSFGGILR